MGKRISSAIGIDQVRVLENIQDRPITSRRRTGRCFWYDDFENYTAVITEKWLQFGGTVALSTAFPKQDKRCMLLTTGAGAGNQAIANIIMGSFPLGRFGIEFDFFSYNAAGIAAFQEVPYVGIRFVDLTWDCYAYIRYLGGANMLWQYYNQAGVWTNIPNGAYDRVEVGDLVANQPNYHNFKMVADFDTGYYVGLWIDSAYFNLEALRMNRTARLVADELVLQVDLSVRTTGAGGAVTMYVDNVILTDQEP